MEASEHEKKYPSTAEDSSSTMRRVQYILTRVLNKLNNLIEVSDTQAVAGLVRFDAGQCSDIFWVYDSKSIENYMLDNMCPKTETDKLSVQSDEESLNENDSLKGFVVNQRGWQTCRRDYTEQSAKESNRHCRVLEGNELSIARYSRNGDGNTKQDNNKSGLRGGE